ncbi:MAG: DUF4328 domain-containing protein [Acidimicrobiales bacterium]
MTSVQPDWGRPARPPEIDEAQPTADAPTEHEAIDREEPGRSSLPPPPASLPIVQFRSTLRVTQVLQVLLSVSIIISAISAASSLRAIFLFSSILADPLSVDPSAIDAVNDRESVLGALQPLMLILVGTGFIVWTSRCYRNMPSLGATSRRFSEGWAIGSWLVPFLNLVRPKQIVDDIWRSSDPELEVTRPRRGSADWKDRPVSPLLHWWWAAYVMIALVALMATLTNAGASASFADSRRSAGWLTAAEIVELVAGILAFVVVTKTSRRMEHRASQIRTQTQSGVDGGDLTPWWRNRTWAPLVFATGVCALILLTGPWAFGRLDAGRIETASGPGSEGPLGEGVLVGELRQGDCANLPNGLGASSQEVTSILAVEVVACQSPHDLEVFALDSYPQQPGVGYPGDEAVTLQGIGLCAGGFEEYVGASWLVSGLDIFLIQPQDQSWRFGDRELICMIRPLDTGRLTGSKEASGGVLTGAQRSPWSLQVGECFNDPEQLGGLVVEIVDCRRPHDNQVYSVVEHRAGVGEPYPGDGVISAFAAQECATSFEIEVAPGLSPNIDFGTYARPFEVAWDGGSRTVVCALWSRDGAKLQDSSLAGS